MSNGEHGEEESEGSHHDRYPLAQVEFDRVKTPFIIGVWILSASIAKIGKFCYKKKFFFISNLIEN